METMSFYAGNSVSYCVIKEKDNYFAIYLKDCGYKELLTHKPTFKQATKIAKLLSLAYQKGYSDAIY